MNILFIYSLDAIKSITKPLVRPEQIQFGISYISSFLKEQGHQTRLIVLSSLSGRKNIGIIDEYLKRFEPKLICFTAVSTEYKFIANTAKYIKSQYPEVYLLIGGPHISLNPEGVLSGAFDALCIGEGENPVLELVPQLQEGNPPSGIPNLWLKQSLEIEKKPPRPFLEDLDNLPFPDRDMWQEWIEEQADSGCSVLLSRGCPFQCTYCCNHALRRLAPGTYVRFRSTDNIVAEIKELAIRFPQKRNIYLETESFSINKGWSMELCSKLERLNATLSYPLSFRVNLRVTPNANFESLFAACKKSNFSSINIGLESGSERVRREILKRDYSNEDVINTVALARKYGLKVSIYNMIGIPGETIADFRETVEINRECLPDRHLTGIFFPYPGTDLYHSCQEQGLISGPLETRMERREAILDLPGFPKRQIYKSYLWFEYYVYKGHKPMPRILAQVFLLWLGSKPRLSSLLRRLSRLVFFQWLRNVLMRG